MWPARTLSAQLYYAVKRKRVSAGAERWTPSASSPVEAPRSSFAPANLAYVQARISGRSCLCLLDSGAEVSLIPVYLVDPQKLQPAQSNRLYAANDTEIIVSGVISLPVVIDQHRYPATFAASENVDEVILGRQLRRVGLQNQQGHCQWEARAIVEAESFTTTATM